MNAPVPRERQAEIDAMVPLYRDRPVPFETIGAPIIGIINGVMLTLLGTIAFCVVYVLVLAVLP